MKDKRISNNEQGISNHEGKTFTAPRTGKRRGQEGAENAKKALNLIHGFSHVQDGTIALDLH